MNNETEPGFSTRYMVVRTIGSGGMGIVHQAIDGVTGATVALKVLHPHMAAQSEFVDRFKSELLLAQRITHKNVCRVFDLHDFNDGVVIAMEYVDGETLETFLLREKPTRDKTISIIGQVIDGLAEAHAQGVVHRDMKPSNIMISRDGAVKVMDFGLARRADSAGPTAAGSVVGTPLYMAPEQAEGKKVDARTDIYSVGLILYEMLTGHHLHRDEIRPEVEFPEIEAIIRKCLQKNREKRFQNASELAAALNAARENSGRRKNSWISEFFLRPEFLGFIPAIVVFALMVNLFQPSSTSKIPIRRHTLQNGLRVILSEDHAAPTYSIAVTYNVGSRNEQPGQTGYAHLFEHMMFQGSENVGKGEHAALVTNNGGNVNGSTAPDYTMFFETLPSNQLDLGLFIEADRMRSLVIDQRNLDSQRATVREERRQRADNEAYGKTMQAVYDLAFDTFAYKHPVIGSTEDLDAAAIKEVADFHRAHYAPSNAVLSLVGDFNPDDVMARIEKYFGKLPAQSRPSVPDMSEAAQEGERRKHIEDRFAVRERIDIAFKIPPGNTADFAALDVLSDVLGDASAGRLYQRLIKDAEVAASAAFTLETRRGPSLAQLTASPTAGKSSAQVERLFSEEISRIKAEGVTEAELERVRRQRRRTRGERYKRTVNRAQDIARYAVLFNEPEMINTFDARYERVSVEDVRRVAAAYFSDSNRTVVITTPKSQRSNERLTQNIARRAELPNAILSSTVERKDRAPISGEILRVKFPRPFETSLENGLTVLVLEDHRFPIVNVQLNISGAGSIYDPTESPGLASVTAQMLSEGTSTRTSRNIAEQVAALGARLSSTSGFGSSATVINASGLSDTFEEWFAIVSDVLRNPTFPADELNGLRQRLRSQLAQQRSGPSFQLSERFNAAVYGSHPARIIAPSIAAIDAMTPEILKGWRRERYSPENTVLAVAGDIRAGEVVRAVKKHLAGWQSAGQIEGLPVAGWQSAGQIEGLPADPPAAAQRKVAVVDRPNSQQTGLMVGNIAINRRSPDLVSVLVGNQILGGSPASRLFVNLREQKGYTYGAFSSVSALKYAGPWRAYTDVRNEAAAPALQSVIDEIQRLQKERVPERELAAAKRSIAAGFALSLEDPNESLNYLILSRVYGYSGDYWDRYPTKIMEVTAEEVQRVTQKIREHRKNKRPVEYRRVVECFLTLVKRFI